MKIAIPVFQARISPRFDCAPRLWLITIADERVGIIERKEMLFQNGNHFARINQLITNGVDVVICGSISNDMLEFLRGKHIDVIPWVTGNAGKALQLFLDGKLVPGTMLCPGKQIRQWKFCTQGQRRRHGKNKGVAGRKNN